MKRARYILLICTLTAVAWSFPGLAHAKNRPSATSKTLSVFDGHSVFNGQ